MLDLFLVSIAIIIFIVAAFFSIVVIRETTEKYVKRTFLVSFSFAIFFLIASIGYLVMVIVPYGNVENLKYIMGIIIFNIAIFMSLIILFSKNVIQKVEYNTDAVSHMNKVLSDKMERNTKVLKRSKDLKEIFIKIMDTDIMKRISRLENFADNISKGQDVSGNSKHIIQDLHGMKNFVANAKIFSEIRDINKEEEKEDIDLNEMIGFIILDFQDQANLKNIKIITEYDKNIKYTIPAFPIIREVFRNLIENALQYTEDNTKVKVSIKEDKDYTTISISDKGDGIKDEFKDKIFKRFELEDKKGIVGTGLGMAISKEIMDIHDGKIWVEDNPEGGSIFKVSFPNEKRLNE